MHNNKLVTPQRQGIPWLSSCSPFLLPLSLHPNDAHAQQKDANAMWLLFGISINACLSTSPSIARCFHIWRPQKFLVFFYFSPQPPSLPSKSTLCACKFGAPPSVRKSYMEVPIADDCLSLLLTHSSITTSPKYNHDEQNCCTNLRKPRAKSSYGEGRNWRGEIHPTFGYEIFLAVHYSSAVPPSATAPICQSLCLLHLMKKLLRDVSVNFKSLFRFLPSLSLSQSAINRCFISTCFISSFTVGGH